MGYAESTVSSITSDCSDDESTVQGRLTKINKAWGVTIEPTKAPIVRSGPKTLSSDPCVSKKPSSDSYFSRNEWGEVLMGPASPKEKDDSSSDGEDSTIIPGYRPQKVIREGEEEESEENVK